MAENSRELSEELTAIANRIDGYRHTKGWSQERLLTEFSGLGTSKVFGAIRQGKTDELNLDNWAIEYRAAIALIEADVAGEENTETLYDDLLPVCELARVVAPLFRTTCNDRLVIVQGEPGSGKTTAAQIIQRRYASQLTMIEAADAWKDSPSALLGDMLLRFKVSPGIGAAARLYQCLEVMRRTRRVLIVDEGHHLGPHCLNTIKTLINQTTWGVVILCIPTLWRKLERGAYEEARQLTTNRLAERVKLSCPVERDVNRMIQRRVPKMPADLLKLASAMIYRDAQTHGGLSFVRDCCGRMAASAADGELTREAIAHCVKREMESR